MNLINNFMTLTFKALSINESFARTVVSSFALQLNPTVEDINDIKTAVSEAVTNSVVHAYPQEKGDITITCKIIDDVLYVSIKDEGIGIEDVEKAKEPFYTTKADQERSGMGFAVMESFMDGLEVISQDKGVEILMYKKINQVREEVVGE